MISLSKLFVWLPVKETVVSDPLCKDRNARFTMVSLKASSDQMLFRYECL